MALRESSAESRVQHLLEGNDTYSPIRFNWVRNWYPEPLPAEIDAAKLKAAVNATFQPAEGLTAAFVVTWKGRLVAERYAEGLTAQTPLDGWSMGKSVTATLFGILVKDGVYDLDQPAPIPEWQTPGYPRAKIRIADILHMSSGL